MTAPHDKDYTRRLEVYRQYLTRDELVPTETVPPLWTADGTGLWRIGGAEEIAIQRIDLRDGTTDEPFDNAAIRHALASRDDDAETGEPSLSVFADLGDGRITLDYGGQSWTLDAAASTIEPRSHAEPDPTPHKWLGHAFPYIVE